MRYFIVYAHPEPRSLNGSLKDAAVQALEAAGHQVRISDLYAMGFKAQADADDFPARDSKERLFYHRASGDAFASGALAADVVREHEKLFWADVLVLQFPLWWFSVPAILKGWIDRVFVNGLAIGVPKEGTKQWLRYGEGRFAGKRAMLAVTTGGREGQFSERGINGPIDDLLFPLNHGLFHYVGMAPLRPFVAFQTVRTTDEEFQHMRARYIHRLLGIWQDQPIPYRFENGGEYESNGILRAGVAEGHTGFRAHCV